jgi:hypothetical protein
MNLKLKYITADGPVAETSISPSETPGYTTWLHSLVEYNRNTIFFYTTETTDIWNDGDYIVTHSCSCHVRNQGPCDICKVLGCEVWDFNQVAVQNEPQ